MDLCHNIMLHNAVTPVNMLMSLRKQAMGKLHVRILSQSAAHVKFLCFNAETLNQPEPIHEDDDGDDDNESKSTESLPRPIGENCFININMGMNYDCCGGEYQLKGSTPHAPF